MNRTAQRLLYILIIISLVSISYALNYMQFTNTEVTVFNDRIKYWGSDSCAGPIRSNSEIAIMQSPVFSDYVITTAADFWHGSGYSPLFVGPRPIFDAPPLLFPENAQWLKEQAIAQGSYFNLGDNMQVRVQIYYDTLRIWWSQIGTPFDTVNYSNFSLADSAIVFFDVPEMHVFGKVSTTLILSARGRIRLEDNIIYASSDEIYGQVAPGHHEKFALISENEVKVMNTIANGRNNSSGLGSAQTDQQLTSIVLNGIFVALNESFTFENQNDPDSGYDYGSVDERGTIFLNGAITQKRRGYVHRANRSGTGYNKHYRYDEQLRYWNIGLFNDARENQITPAGLEFGQVLQGSHVTDSITIYNDFVPIEVTNLQLALPFVCTDNLDTSKWNPTIRVTFDAFVVGEFFDTLRGYLNYYHTNIAIPVHGVCLQPNQAQDGSTLNPTTLTLSAFPNPFNASTEIRYSLPHSGEVSLALFDILGRQQTVLSEGYAEQGNHRLTFNASDLASGVYFVRINSSAQTVTQKLLLMK